MGARRCIKRYANRKLYDTRESRYVTLRDIAQLVESGEEIRVVDNRTQQDLTYATLAQIVYEAGRGVGVQGVRTSMPRSCATAAVRRLEGLLGRSSAVAAAELFAPLRHLQAEVLRLQRRVAELEAELRQAHRPRV